MREDEERRLKLKINRLIDTLEEKDKKIAELEVKVNTLETECSEQIGKVEQESKKVSSEEDAAGAAAAHSEIAVFFEQFGQIVKKIHTNGQFIPYKNTTKYSQDYCKVERNTFEGYVDEIVPEAKEFLEKCKGFLCFKSENGKCVFNNDRIRVYFLNRQLINIMLGCASEDAAPDAGDQSVAKAV